MNTFYITTPIYYANSAPHLGSLYTTLVADAMRRFKRQRGLETYFLTGTDEHGINIERAAERANRTPKEHVDDTVAEFKRAFAEFGLDAEHGGYDFFVRTTSSFHYAGVSALWKQIAGGTTPKGRAPIYKGFYEGWFCAPCAAYKTEDEYTKAQEPGDPPRCLIHEVALDRIAEESYFFRLSDYSEALLELYESGEGFIRPEARRNEVISFVRGGLQDLSISRMRSSVAWGIPVPDDPDHTVYVWLDALTNYITAIGYGNEERERAVGFEKFWPAVHLVGKDILRFHAVYWPAFLMAANLPVPRTVFAHGMLLDATGRKMSKTLGNAVDLNILHRHFPDTDVIRYFCLREVAFGQDAKFSYELIIDRANADLAGGLGNLSSRTLTMIDRYCAGRIPAAILPEEQYLAAKRANIDPDDQAFATALEHARDQSIGFFEDYAFNRAVEAAWSILSRADKMISDAKPWDLAKTEAQRGTLELVLYRAAEALRWLAVLLHPVMPEATGAIWRQLGQTTDLSKIDPGTLQWGGLTQGTPVGTIKPLFPRIDKGKTMAEIEKEVGIPPEKLQSTQNEASSSAAAASTRVNPGSTERGSNSSAQSAAGGPSATPNEQSGGGESAPEGVVSSIEIGDFARVEMRVGQILTAERVPKSDKLLRFTVDLGEAAPRQILAGIAEHYEPEPLVGRKIVVVSNLKPRKLRGFESQGMVLAASVGEAGRPVLATFVEDVPNGARLK